SLEQLIQLIRREKIAQSRLALPGDLGALKSREIADRIKGAETDNRNGASQHNGQRLRPPIRKHCHGFASQSALLWHDFRSRVWRRYPAEIKPNRAVHRSVGCIARRFRP